MTQLALDAEALYQQLCRQVAALVQGSGAPAVGLVGIWSGGAWLAERLHKDLGLPGSAGSLSITLHRDDYAERGLSSTQGATRLPFEVDGRHLILVDDLL